MSVSEADRLLARGAPITLAGEPVRLILTFEALEMLEEEFGGLDVFVASLREEGLKAKRLRNVRKGMTAALLHRRPPEQDLADFELEVREKLDFKDFLKYLEALMAAITEAMPIATSDERPKGTRSANSHGRASTGTRRSGMAALTASSGA